MIKRASFNNIRRQGGFTMVELAIVLVIVGIILAAVLKGTDMINKAKIERMTADLRGLQAMILEDEKRTGFLPGDCDHNGIIGYTQLPQTMVDSNVNLGYSNDPDPDVAGDCVSQAGVESATDAIIAWGDMRKANIVDPTRGNIEIARHTLSDYYTIGSFTSATDAADYNFIVVYGVPLWLAKGLDVALDGPQNLGGEELLGGARGRLRLYAAGAAGGGATVTPDGAAWPNNENLNGDYQLVSVSYQFDTRMAQPVL